MINSIVLVGRLVKDIELRYNNNNNAVGSFTLAVPRNYKNANGEYETDFINCVGFGKMIETASNYAHKGDVLGIRGSLQTRTYKDKEGNKKYITEVLSSQISFLQSKKTQENSCEEKSIEKVNFDDIDVTDDLPF